MNMRSNKTKLNFIIDCIMFLVLMAIAGIGFMIKFILIPGFKRNVIHGKNTELYFLGLDRHQWGSIHLSLSFIFLVLLLFHIILHWDMVVCIFKRLVLNKAWRVIIISVFVIVSFAFFMMPLFINPEIRQVTGHRPNYSSHGNKKNIFSPVQLEYNKSNNEIQDTSIFINSNEISNDFTSSGRNHQDEKLHNLEVYGYMTLNEVAAKYNIPANELALIINVPRECTSVKLGRLRKKYGFHLDDLRNYIAFKNEKN